MLRRHSGPLAALLATGSARRVEADGPIELVLTREEAAQGGMATISMNVAVGCPRCPAGAGSACARCGGTGQVESLYSAWIAVRPGTADGAAIEPSVQLRGVLRPVRFIARVRA